jgi:hypothetical protein
MGGAHGAPTVVKAEKNFRGKAAKKIFREKGPHGGPYGGPRGMGPPGGPGGGGAHPEKCLT